MMYVIRRYLILVTIFGWGTAHAYIGPGAGLSAIGSVVALFGGLLLLVIGFLWYPLKRMMKKNKQKSAINIEDSEK